jgi:hypothetical protein
MHVSIWELCKVQSVRNFTYFPGSLGRHLDDLSVVDAMCVCSRNKVAGKALQKISTTPKAQFSGPLKR